VVACYGAVLFLGRNRHFNRTPVRSFTCARSAACRWWRPRDGALQWGRLYV